MSIELTQAAKDQLDKMLSDDRYMRIALNKTGCCNFTLDFLRGPDEIKGRVDRRRRIWISDFGVRKTDFGQRS